MRERITTLLDTVGLVAVAAGAGLHGYGWIVTLAESRGVTALAAGAGLILAGTVLLAGSWLADRRSR